MIILVVDIIVPNKTSEAPNKKFMFIISLKKIIPQIDPNKTCKLLIVEASEAGKFLILLLKKSGLIAWISQCQLSKLIRSNLG